MVAALEIPSLFEDLVVGFPAVGEGDPGVAFTHRAAEASGIVCRHGRPLLISMIPVCQESDGNQRMVFLEE
jgi:hypothetical protein